MQEKFNQNKKRIQLFKIMFRFRQVFQESGIKIPSLSIKGLLGKINKWMSIILIFAIEGVRQIVIQYSNRLCCEIGVAFIFR